MFIELTVLLGERETSFTIAVMTSRHFRAEVYMNETNTHLAQSLVKAPSVPFLLNTEALRLSYIPICYVIRSVV